MKMLRKAINDLIAEINEGTQGYDVEHIADEYADIFYDCVKIPFVDDDASIDDMVSAIYSLCYVEVETPDNPNSGLNFNPILGQYTRVYREEHPTTTKTSSEIKVVFYRELLEVARGVKKVTPFGLKLKQKLSHIDDLKKEA